MFDAYKIGVTLSLTNHVSKGLMLMAGDFARTEAEASKLQKRIDAIKSEAMKGGLMIGAGAGMLALLKAPIDAAREYEIAFTKFKTMNLGDMVNKQADQFARSANLMGVTSKELMTTMSESVGLFGNFDMAKKVAPVLATLNKANSAIFQGKIDHIDEGSTRSLMKFIDRRGGTHDEATFMRNLDLAERMVTGSGGFIQFKDLNQFSQQGGTAFRGLSDEGIMNMSLLLQEQGGARAGTAQMSMYQNLIAGRTPKKTMAMLQEFGLGTMAMETHGSVGGKPMKSLVMKDLAGADMLQSNPTEWFRQYALPAAAKHGITSEAAILKFVNDILSNRTASGQGSIMSTQLLQILRDANLTKNAMGSGAVIEAYKNDPNSKFADLQAKYNGLMVELGNAVLPVVIRALDKLIPAMRDMAAWVDKNQRLTKELATAFVVLAGAIAFGGAVKLLSAAFSGLGIALKFLGVGGPRGITAIGKSMGGFSKCIGLVGKALSAFSWVLIGLEAARMLGLPDTNLRKGHKDVREGNWLAASADLPLVDFIKAVISRAHLSAGPDLYPSMDGKKGWYHDHYANAQANKSVMDNYVPGAAVPAQMINNTIVMPDGRVLAKIVTQEQSKAAVLPQVGRGGFDPTRMPISPGMNIR